MKKIFKIPHMSVKDMCTAALLLAITVVLAIFGTFRIGNAIKIPIKFISVFISAYLFGPWIGGFCGGMGDILNALIVPVGAWLPQLTALEFLSGFIYGALFYSRKSRGAGYILRVVVCTVLLFLSDMLLTTAVLVQAGYFPSFEAAFSVRIAAGIIKAVLQLAVLSSGCGYLTLFKRIGRK